MFPVETHRLTRLPVLPTPRGGGPVRVADRLAALVPPAIARAIEADDGDVLVFLPGQGEIRRVATRLAAPGMLPPSVDVHTLFGEMPLEAQDAALRRAPPGRRKVVLATNVAETSLTIEGVRVVVDGGYARVPRYDVASGMTRLVTAPVSHASAEQRRGRAGRTAPGVCYRLWTAADDEHRADALAARNPRRRPRRSRPRPRPLGRPRRRRSPLARCPARRAPSPPRAPSSPTLAPSPPTGRRPPTGAPSPVWESTRASDTSSCVAWRRATERPLAPSPRSSPNAICSAARQASSPSIFARDSKSLDGRGGLPGIEVDDGVRHRVRDLARQLRQRASVRDERVDPSAAGRLVALAYPDRLAQRDASDGTAAAALTPADGVGAAGVDGG